MSGFPNDFDGPRNAQHPGAAGAFTPGTRPMQPNRLRPAQPNQPPYANHTPAPQRPHYAQPSYGYTPPYGAPMPEVPGAAASLVFGILSLFFMTCPVLGLLFGIFGMSRGSSAKQAALQMRVPAGVAQGGYVCSVIGVVFGCFLNLIMLVALLLG